MLVTKRLHNARNETCHQRIQRVHTWSPECGKTTNIWCHFSCNFGCLELHFSDPELP